MPTSCQFAVEQLGGRLQVQSACVQSAKYSCLQMGGAEGVGRAEITSLITGTKEGILMNVHPRKGNSGLPRDLQPPDFPRPSSGYKS